MSSDNPGAAGLSPDYRSSWPDLIRRFVSLILSDHIITHSWDDNDTVILRGKGRVLGVVQSVSLPKDAGQRHIVMKWRNLDWKKLTFLRNIAF